MYTLINIEVILLLYTSMLKIVFIYMTKVKHFFLIFVFRSLYTLTWYL